MTLEAIKEEVQRLPRTDKAALAGQLVSELFPHRFDEDLALECEAIIDGVDKGAIETADGPQFFNELRAQLSR